MQGHQVIYYILHATPASKIFEVKVLAPGQNLSLLLGRGIGSSFIPTENVNNSRITGECKEKALDPSEKNPTDTFKMHVKNGYPSDTLNPEQKGQ